MAGHACGSDAKERRPSRGRRFRRHNGHASVAVVDKMLEPEVERLHRLYDFRFRPYWQGGAILLASGFGAVPGAFICGVGWATGFGGRCSSGPRS